MSFPILLSMGSCGKVPKALQARMGSALIGSFVLDVILILSLIILGALGAGGVLGFRGPISYALLGVGLVFPFAESAYIAKVAYMPTGGRLV